MKIEELFAFVIEDSPGNEGVPAFSAGEFIHPLIGSDFQRIDSLRPMAKEFATRTGKQVTLLKFTVREELEVIEP